MGKVIKADFRNEKSREEAAFRAFEEAFAQHQRRQRNNAILAFFVFCVLIFAIVSIPFLLEHLLL